MDTFGLTANHIMPTYGRQPLAAERGEGAWLWDETGKRHLDFCTGIAVCSLGHCHPAMIGAVEKQARKLWHCSNLYHIREQAELAAFINDTVMAQPGRVFFSNSGAEANDGLIKAARRYGHARPGKDGQPRTLVLTFRQSFHGRTLGGIAATGQDKVKEGFDPMLPGFRHLPFNDTAALAEAMAGGEVVAILLEALQGEGGVNAATPEFLRAAADLCQRHDALFLFDEVQCGMGRTGGWRGWEDVLGDATIQPDGVSWAKGMGGGYPIGAFWLGEREVKPGQPLHQLLGPGSHGSTYGGSPMASAVSLAVLREISKPEIFANVAARSRQLREGVLALDSPFITGIRGAGLLLGLTLDVAALEKCERLPPGPTAAMRVVHACREAGLLVPPAGTDVVRLLPPLNVTAEECAHALETLRRVLG
jgi:acetylornithine/succinyldiaminopimelate/putrescine aminotransferase